MTELRAEHNMPGPQQREELLRIAELYTSGRINPPPVLHQGTTSLKSETQNDSLDIPSESACSLCGADTQSPDFKPSDHGENICGRGTIACPLCAKTFTLWNHYEAHKKCHQKLKQRQYPCQTCGKVKIVLLHSLLQTKLINYGWIYILEFFKTYIFHFAGIYISQQP